MVGEIRDLETASIAVKAALTGHLVLSTLHTNDAASAIGRLIDMGIEPFLVSSSVNLILAQRLVRRVCASASAGEAARGGAARAGRHGERGRVAYLTSARAARLQQHRLPGRVGRLRGDADDRPTLRDLILERASAPRSRTAVEEGMLTLRMDGLEKLKDGMTTLEEVLKETAKQ